MSDTEDKIKAKRRITRSKMKKEVCSRELTDEEFEERKESNKDKISSVANKRSDIVPASVDSDGNLIDSFYGDEKSEVILEEIDPFDDPLISIDILPREEITRAQERLFNDMSEKAFRLGMYKMSPDLIELNKQMNSRMRYEVYNSDGTLALESTTRWNKFLNALEITGSVRKACKEANISINHYYRRYNTSERFRRICKEVSENSIQLLKDEALRRAVDGVREPVWYKGKIVGEKLSYSDSLLLALLKSKDPAFKEEIKNVNINQAASVVDPTPQDNFSALRKLLEEDNPEANIDYVQEDEESDETDE